jgi:hypothetical protein
MANNITCTILENGTVRIDTDQISGPNHATAEAALQWIANQLGGDVTRTRRVDIHQHIHMDEHDHDHDHTHA